MSSEGKNKTVLLKAPATQVKIDDFAGDHITYSFRLFAGRNRHRLFL